MAGDRQRYLDALNLAAQHAWDKEWREAIEQLETAVAEFSDDPVAYSQLGQAYFELAEYDTAFRYYQYAVRLDPGDTAALARTADILERMGRIEEAARIYMAVAEAHLKERDLDSAVSNWERATRLAPDLLGARQRLAVVYEKMGRHRDSVRERLAMARIYQAQGDVGQAAAVCKEALEADPNNPDVLAAVSLLQQGLELEEPALPPGDSMPVGALAGDVVASAIDALESGEPLGWAEEQEPEWEGAGSPVEDARQAALADLAEIIFEEEPSAGPVQEIGDRDALIGKAIELQTRGEIDDAIESYELAIMSGVRQPAARFNLGLLYQERLRLDEAIEQLQASVQDPEYRLGSHFALGECYRAKGRFDEAITHFVEVAKIVDMQTVKREQVGDLVRLYEGLASTYAMKGEQEQAARFANALVEFLGTKGWQDKVREAREHLDELADGGQTMSLAEILTLPGSDELLESISMSSEFARRGWPDTALEECYRAVQLAPFYLPTHVRLARLLQERGNTEGARNKLVTVAQTYRARRDITRAANALEQAVALDPLDIGLRSRMVEMLKRHGEIDRALEHSVAMADAYYQLAQVDKARDTYLSALHLAPRGDPEKQWPVAILHRVADIDMQRLSWRDAVSIYKQIVRQAPDDERANVTLVELLFKMDRGHEAMAELDRFLERLASLNRSKRILAILNDLLSQQPDDTGLLSRLAAAYAQTGEREKAIEHLDRLGELQLDAGLREDAGRTIEAILSLGPAEVEGYQHLLAQIKKAP